MKGKLLQTVLLKLFHTQKQVSIVIHMVLLLNNLMVSLMQKQLDQAAMEINSQLLCLLNQVNHA
jgi:hypothetical protein